MQNNFICTYCEKKFTLRSNLTKHVRIVHGVCSEGSLPCPKCNEVLKTISEVRTHLQDVHEVKQIYEEIKFSSMQEFDKWKTEIQESTNDVYIQHYGSQPTKQGRKTYLYCHRSGTFNSKSTGVRNIKSQGSNKIGKLCTAAMEVSESNSDTNVCVKFWKTHVGHISEIGRTVLPDDAKESFADKLAAGVSIKGVLNDIRENQISLNRTTLTEAQDLRNLKKKLLDKEAIHHSNDVLSVELFLTELMTLEHNPVLYYKRQGMLDETGVLNANDIMIVLMTEFQREMLEKFGTDKICIDSTHGTNAYDYQLITLLTIDEFSNGCPVCYCVTNRLDTEAMKCFFEKVQQKVGTINSDVFMSDDAPAFFNAWKSIMTSPKHRLLCAWHVHKNLTENLNKIDNAEKRKIALQTIKVILHEPCVERFEIMLANFLEDLENDTESSNYHSYLLKHYIPRKLEWASAYRVNLGINTNMHLEAFHKVLKYHYLDGVRNRRLDNCLKAILKVARDKIYDRMIKISKNKYSSADKHVQASHNKAMSFDNDAILRVSESSFLVQSETDSEMEYSVTKESIACQNCRTVCRVCKICIHTYACTCLDFGINKNICKHIHACEMLLKQNMPQNADEVSTVEKEMAALFDHVAVQSTNNANDVINLATTIARVAKESAPLNKESHETVVRNLKQVLDILGQSNINDTVRCHLEPTNKKIASQRRFISTKRKRKRTAAKGNDIGVNFAAGLLGEAAEDIDDPIAHDHTYIDFEQN